MILRFAKLTRFHPHRLKVSRHHSLHRNASPQVSNSDRSTTHQLRHFLLFLFWSRPLIWRLKIKPLYLCFSVAEASSSSTQQNGRFHESRAYLSHPSPIPFHPRYEMDLGSTPSEFSPLEFFHFPKCALDKNGDGKILFSRPCCSVVACAWCEN